MGTSAAGGLGSAISGGGFWQGFGTGLAIGAFNHLIGSLLQNPKYEIYITVTDKIVGSITYTSLGVDYETPLYEATVSGIDIDGNAINETVSVSRFGVKNGVQNPALAPGTYLAKWDKMSSGIQGFRVNGGPYFFHQTGQYANNFGCFGMSSKHWTLFKESIMKSAGGSSLKNINSKATINVSVLNTPTYKIKYP
jgi:hypothetical protein